MSRSRNAPWLSVPVYHLNGLSQSHLVPDYPPSLLTVQFPQPLHTSLLVPGIIHVHGIVHVYVYSIFHITGLSKDQILHTTIPSGVHRIGEKNPRGHTQHFLIDPKLLSISKYFTFKWAFNDTGCLGLGMHRGCQYLYSLCHMLPGILRPPSNTLSSCSADRVALLRSLSYSLQTYKCSEP